MQLIVNEKLNDDNYVFTSNRGRKYHKRTIRKIIDNACKRAGLKMKISPHTFRHSFATHLIEQGNSVSEVQSLLGHKSPETTFVYLHTASPNMIKVMSPFDTFN